MSMCGVRVTISRVEPGGTGGAAASSVVATGAAELRPRRVRPGPNAMSFCRRSRTPTSTGADAGSDRTVDSGAAAFLNGRVVDFFAARLAAFFRLDFGGPASDVFGGRASIVAMRER